MSYELYIYSEHAQHLEKDRLRVKLHQEGWDVAFMASDGKLFYSSAGPLDTDTLIVGWEADDEGSQQFRHLIEEQDVNGLTAFAQETSLLASCAVFTIIPYSFAEEYTPAEVEELEDVMGADYIREAQKAKTYYYLRTSAGRSPLSLELQEATWRAIGALVGGLSEDPQEGTWEVIEAENGE